MLRTALRQTAPVLVSLLAAACSGGSSHTPPPPAGPGASDAPNGQAIAPTTGIVAAGPPAATTTAAPTSSASTLPNVPGLRGHVQTTYVVESGEYTVPQDFTTAPPSVLVPSSTGYDVFAGQGDAQGAFVVPNVPEGVMALVKIGNYYVETTARDVTLASALLGRETRRDVTRNTRVQLSVGGMSAWGEYDFVTLFSENAGVAAFNYLHSATTSPSLGATTLGALVDHAAATTPRFIDAAIGDKTRLFHYTNDPATNCRRATEVADLSTFSTADGQTASFTSQFAAIPSSATLSVNWKVGFYESHRLSVHPLATQYAQELSVAALPSADRYGSYDTGPILAYCGFVNPSPADLPLTVAYGNAFPARYVPFVAASETYSVPVSLPGAPSGSIYGSIVNVKNVTTGTFDGVVSPPRNLKVGNRAAQTEATDVGMTPIVAWDAPVVGKVVRYDVRLAEVLVSGGALEEQTVASFTVKGTSVRLPPGLLAAGKHYYVTVTAFSSDESSYDDTLGGKGFGLKNAARADALSSLFLP